MQTTPKRLRQEMERLGHKAHLRSTGNKESLMSGTRSKSRLLAILRSARVRLGVVVLLSVPVSIIPNKHANACAHCCTPYTYLQFCCYGCINADYTSLARAATEYAAVVNDLVQLVQSANSFRQELQNDVTILTTIGSQINKIPEMVTQYAYAQGIQWIQPSWGVSQTVQNFQGLYLFDQSSNNIGQPSANAFMAMKQDLANNAGITMASAAAAGTTAATDMQDLANIAQQITATNNKREDLQVNSRVKEKVVELEQLHSALLAQYIGLRARQVAAPNQTDLSPTITGSGP
jgi:hypothetical protein